jgi:apolipoprotein N-acyltransferase
MPLIRSANTGVSCIINQKGRIISYVEKNGEKIFVEGETLARVYPAASRTFYTVMGDVFALSCIMTFMILYTVRETAYNFMPFKINKTI